MGTSRRKLLGKWRAWLRVIWRDVVDLHHRRRVFLRVADAFEKNTELHDDNTFWEWMATNYAWAVALGVRRQADSDSDVISMARLLADLEDHAPILTRDWFVRAYVSRPPADRHHFLEPAHRAFDQFAARKESYVSIKRIQVDRKRLEKVAWRVTRWVNRRLAHQSMRPLGVRGVSLRTVYGAIDELGRLYTRCALLLNQASSGPLPTLLGDWEKPFRIPWEPPLEHPQDEVPPPASAEAPDAGVPQASSGDPTRNPQPPT